MSQNVDPYTEIEAADALGLVTGAMNEAERFSTSYVQKVEARYRAYRGIAEARKSGQEIEAWRSNLTTPYILQTIEGMIATMLDPNPRWEVKPRPQPFEPIEVILARTSGGRIASAALEWAMQNDDFHLKQRPFMQQDLIAGKTVAKIVWKTMKTRRTVLTPSESQILNQYGTVVSTFPTTEEKEKLITTFDGPTMIVRDVRDFFRPESAIGVDDAAWVIDRSWETYQCLKDKERAGLYRNVDEVKNAQNTQLAQQYTDREQLLRGQERTSGLIEVLEYWTNDRVITVAARTVVLSDIPNPYRNGRKPFVICSALPDAFQMDGISVVESLGQIQEYLWSMQNQRLDNIKIMNNHVTLIRSDVDDADSFEFFPGAQWFVEDTEQVKQLPVDPTLGEMTIQTEQLLKGDLQNIMGGLPMAGGVSSGTIDQQTATGMNIITGIAQKIIQARKQHYAWAFAQVGEQFLGLMGQMMRRDRVIQVVGKSGAEALLIVNPLDLQGDFDVQVNVLDDVMLQGERRSSAQALMQAAAGVAPLTHLNMDAFVENLLDAYDIRDKPKYFAPAPGTAGAAQAPGAQAPPQPGEGTPSAQNIQESTSAPVPTPAGNGLTAPPSPQVAQAAQASPGAALAPAGRQY